MFNLIKGYDFDAGSAGKGVCFVSGQPKRPTDKGIFRGPEIEHVGYLDVCQKAIENAARDLGWVPPEQHEAEVNDLKAALLNAKTQLKDTTQTPDLKELKDVCDAIYTYLTDNFGYIPGDNNLTIISSSSSTVSEREAPATAIDEE